MTILPTRRWVADASRTALVTLGLLSLALPGAAFATTVATQMQAPDSAAIERQNRAIVEAAFEKWRGGTYVFAELLAPDVVWTIHGSGPVAGTYRNQKDFIEQASRPLTSRLATPIVPEVHGIFADGGTIIIRFDGTATTTSGAPYRNQFVWIFKMKDGLVVNAEAFLDLVAYQQVVDNNAPRSQ
ncbi:nuclear transport factor 2 family protein [Rhizobium changzhiense]|uniref:Nuclear transport factor 2 family protein n=1 Tax=Rhizobium changzhiense TaxID=2692317 RepID=A0ABR6ACU4_9HYPH|nr:nuclear transport factor 2 family protein [Rhizobium changzhiense]MBA5804474.1 nuclear transport factor 2 family protein [Rhizobium changzhiense]MCH4550627.1 nuclear transport factor 2 family protein [Rhizobium changzhiense]NNU51119.1 nuclear transport factor 2 family protein [Rhizobium changzhiense]